MTHAILITILAIILSIERGAIGQFGFANPLVAGTLVGVVLGDIKTGIEVAIPLQLIFMGAVQVGAAVPPDALVGTIIGASLAIKGIPVDAAIAIAVPVAFVAGALDTIRFTLNTFALHFMDRLIEKERYTAFSVVHMTFNQGLIVITNLLVVFPAIYYGADAVQGLLTVIPAWILTGFTAAAGMLPALGFGMLIQMIGVPHLMPFLFIGFVTAAFLPINLIGIAILGICFAILYDYVVNKLKGKGPGASDLDSLLKD